MLTLTIKFHGVTGRKIISWYQLRQANSFEAQTFMYNHKGMMYIWINTERKDN